MRPELAVRVRNDIRKNPKSWARGGLGRVEHSGLVRLWMRLAPGCNQWTVAFDSGSFPRIFGAAGVLPASCAFAVESFRVFCPQAKRAYRGL